MWVCALRPVWSVAGGCSLVLGTSWQIQCRWLNEEEGSILVGASVRRGWEMRLDAVKQVGKGGIRGGAIT